MTTETVSCVTLDGNDTSTPHHPPRPTSHDDPKLRPMVSLTQYLTLLRIYFDEKASGYGVSRMGIFGSVARNQDTDESDIDIIYEGAPNLLLRSRMRIELEELLGRPVDLVRHRHNARSQEFETIIAKDIVYV